MKRLDQKTQHKIEENCSKQLQTILNSLSQESGHVVKRLQSEIQKQRTETYRKAGRDEMGVDQIQEMNKG